MILVDCSRGQLSGLLADGWIRRKVNSFTSHAQCLVEWLEGARSWNVPGPLTPTLGGQTDCMAADSTHGDHFKKKEEEKGSEAKVF